jgi:hypothetical protein
MARRAIEQIDEMRRNGQLSWEEYAIMLQERPAADWTRLLSDFGRGIRDRAGRLRELEDLGLPKR